MKQFGFLVAALTAVVLWACVSQPEGPPPDWRDDWAVAQGFSLSVDSEGYRFPTAIAFVPEPGPDPKDPLYFVTEMRGTVKVVANDRTVHTFAEGFSPLDPALGLESHSEQFGLVGICLAPEEGYVFVTLAYRIRGELVRNMVVRFDSMPHTFSLQAHSHAQILEIFDNYEFKPNHQLGACQVHDSHLYIGSGDYEDRENIRDVNSLFGKILRVTLDGKPAADNPFYEDDDEDNPRNYVWAYGFRNPFGLEVARGRFFVTDNGLDIDRILEVQEGENYLWNGDDWSIGTRADAVIAPAVAPTHIEFAEFEGSDWPDEHRNSFFVATVGKFSPVAPEGILRFDYDFENGRLVDAPEYFVQRRGEQIQPLVALAVAPDGLYFASLFPNAAGMNPVYRASYDPENAHSHVIGEDRTAIQVLTDHKCLACHSLQQVGGTVGPPLDATDLIARLDERLHSDEYLRSLDEVDQLESEPYLSYAAARQDVRESQGAERIRTWVQYRLQEPRFDNPDAQMPNPGLTAEEAAEIADLLLAQPGGWERAKETLRDFLPSLLNWRHLLYAFLGGAAAMLLLAGGLKLAGLVRVSVVFGRRGEPTDHTPGEG